MRLDVNGRSCKVDDADPRTPLLWVLREQLSLSGTKYGCGIGICGACTVHLDGDAVRSCVTPCSASVGRQVTTIEALSATRMGAVLQAAWVAHQVPQCGYCQSGMLMAASALLQRRTTLTAADIDAAITNLCRCGTYPRVKSAILDAAERLGS